MATNRHSTTVEVNADITQAESGLKRLSDLLDQIARKAGGLNLGGGGGVAGGIGGTGSSGTSLPSAPATGGQGGGGGGQAPATASGAGSQSHGRGGGGGGRGAGTGGGDGDVYDEIGGAGVGAWLASGRVGPGGAMMGGGLLAANYLASQRAQWLRQEQGTAIWGRRQADLGQRDVMAGGGGLGIGAGIAFLAGGPVGWGAAIGAGAAYIGSRMTGSDPFAATLEGQQLLQQQAPRVGEMDTALRNMQFAGMGSAGNYGNRTGQEGRFGMQGPGGQNNFFSQFGAATGVGPEAFTQNALAFSEAAQIRDVKGFEEDGYGLGFQGITPAMTTSIMQQKYGISPEAMGGWAGTMFQPGLGEFSNTDMGLSQGLTQTVGMGQAMGLNPAGINNLLTQIASSTREMAARGVKVQGITQFMSRITDQFITGKQGEADWGPYQAQKATQVMMGIGGGPLDQLLAPYKQIQNWKAFGQAREDAGQGASFFDVASLARERMGDPRAQLRALQKVQGREEMALGFMSRGMMGPQAMDLTQLDLDTPRKGYLPARREPTAEERDQASREGATLGYLKNMEDFLRRLLNLAEWVKRTVTLPAGVEGAKESAEEHDQPLGE